MRADVSRRGLKTELNYMGGRRTHDFTTARRKIYHRDRQRLWSRELPRKRTHTLSTLDQPERAKRLHGGPDRHARYTEKPRKFLFRGKRFARRVTTFCYPILKNQEDLVVKRDVATPLQKRLWKRGRAL
jgi:hypothetical protein